MRTNTTAPQAQTPVMFPAGLPFFESCGKYQVAPATTATQLHEDANLWLEAAQDIVSGLACLCDEHGEGDGFIVGALYGARHLIRMARGALDATNKLDAMGGVA